MNSPEADLQKGCVQWFRLQYREYSNLLFHVPNGGYRNKTEAAKFKKMGVVAGVSDLLLLLPRHGFGCLCIELKSEKGVMSEHQQEWRDLTIEAGNAYSVVNSIELFMQIINAYIHDEEEFVEKIPLIQNRYVEDEPIEKKKVLFQAVKKNPKNFVQSVNDMLQDEEKSIISDVPLDEKIIVDFITEKKKKKRKTRRI
jgi:hypothetical protein